MTKRFFYAILAIMMCVAVFPFSAIADGSEPSVGELEIYYGLESTLSTDAADGLLKDSIHKNLYRAYKQHITALAENGGKTSLTLEASVLGSISVTVSKGEDVSAALKEKLYSIEFTDIMNCLVVDCPYEMFWYDKTVGLKLGFKYEYSETTATVTSLTTVFSVSEDYRADGYSASTPEITTDLKRVKDAVAEAKRVVESNKGKSDIDKLSSYKEYICRETSYNGNDDQPYGDPWQLIYVFDRDPATKVLCEGYVKAFQYLCNLTDWEGDIGVYTVMGTMAGNEGVGNHMWNVIVTDSGNYIADITNSDIDSVGEDGELFMNAEPKSGGATGYVFNISGQDVAYAYNALTIEMYSSEIRTLGLKKVATEARYGDPSGDGMINAQDAALILQYDVKLINGFKNGFGVDVSGDGTVNAQDAALILQYDVKLIKRFPVENK